MAMQEAVEAPRTPGQWYAGTVGAFLAALGVVALVVNGLSFGTIGTLAGQPDLLIWETSGWTTILWIAAGALGLLATARLDASRTYALAAGVAFAAIAVWGFIDGNDAFGIIAAGTTNNITHAVIGALGLMTAMLPGEKHREYGAGRSREERVAEERRLEREPGRRTTVGR